MKFAMMLTLNCALCTIWHSNSKYVHAY